MHYTDKVLLSFFLSVSKMMSQFQPPTSQMEADSLVFVKFILLPMLPFQQYSLFTILPCYAFQHSLLYCEVATNVSGKQMLSMYTTQCMATNVTNVAMFFNIERYQLKAQKC